MTCCRNKGFIGDALLANSYTAFEICYKGNNMNTTDVNDVKAIERQRERVRSFCRDNRFEDAADLCAALSEEVLIFTPCEAIADYLRKTRPAEAARLYEIAAAGCRFEGTQATGSGEGIEAMDNLHRVEDKLKKLKY